MKRLLSIAVILLHAVSARGQGALLPALPPAFTNQYGLPASGAKLCAFAAGTTTPLALYSDSGLSTSAPNPNSLNVLGQPTSNGTTRISLYTLARNYKVILYQAGATGSACPLTGTPIWTQDNVPAGNIWEATFATKLDDKVCHASQYTGADEAAKIAACIAVLPSTGGAIDIRGLQGAQTWGSDPFTGVTKPIDLICDGGTRTLTAGVTIPQNVTIFFGEGCIFTGGVTMNFNGKVSNPHNAQIFSTSLTLNLAGGNEPYPEWFGGKPDGTTNNSSAIQAAITSFTGNSNPYGGTIGPSGGGWSTLRFSPGVYAYFTGITVAHSGIALRGAGWSSTILRFLPGSSGLTSWSFDAGSDQIHDITMEDMTLDAYGSSAARVKTALYIHDVSEASWRNLQIRAYFDTTEASRCLKIHGREQLIFENVVAGCNQAVYIGALDNAANEGLDLSMFHNVQFANLTTFSAYSVAHPVVEISEADAFLTNVTFDGFDFVGGSYSFYWSNTNAKTGPYNVLFKNGRNEPGSATITNWGFYVAPPSNLPLSNLVFQNVRLDGGAKGGWYFRNISNGSMDSSTYNALASSAVISADDTVHMSFTNMNWNVHTATNYLALDGWTGLRYNEDTIASTNGTGQISIRSGGIAQMILGSLPAGTTYSITAGSCSGNQLTLTIGAHTFAVGAQITVAGVTPSGINGTYTVTASAGNTVTVTNIGCPLTYSSGGAGAVTYGPLSYIGTNSVLSNPGDLSLRSDGSNVNVGFNGTRTAAFQASGGLMIDNSASSTVSTGQLSMGSTVVAAGSSGCPTTITTNAGATAPAGCWVINVAGTARVVPFF